MTDLDSRSHEVQVHFPHERVDSFKTTFGTRAFEDSFRDQLPIMVWAHDLRDPIGRASRAQVLPKHNEVIGKFSDLDKVPSAARAFAQIDDGTISDFSFGYVGGMEYPHPDPQLRRRGVRQIPKATMREISPVSIGSIPGAKVAGIREDGNLVTADSPESVIRLVELKVITPEVGNHLLRGFGFFDGLRADGGGPWTTADAVAHLQEAHGIDAYQAGLTNSSPQTLAILHAQVGSGMAHDHGAFQGWLTAIAADVARAKAAGGDSLMSSVDQGAADRVAAGAGYPVSGGRVGGPGDASLAVLPLAEQVAAGAGYSVSRGVTGLETRGTEDCQSLSRMAQEAATAAEGAANTGDGPSAGERARQARMYARSARQAMRASNPTDLTLVHQAEEAAIRASGLVDELDAGGTRDWSDHPVRADDVFEVLERHNPQLAMQLRGAQVAIAPQDVEIFFRAPDGSLTDGSGAAVSEGLGLSPEVSELALNLDGALDAARQWLDGLDVANLPEEAQQALALVGAAAEGSGALLEVMGASGGRAASDDDFSDTPWEQFDESDYSPEQYKSAALIDIGKGSEDSKERYALPVKEPSGKLNRHGIAAAASRINQVQAPDSEKKKAARTLMSYYGKMKKSAPPNVLKIVGQGERADEEEAKRAQELLERRLSSRPTAGAAK